MYQAFSKPENKTLSLNLFINFMTIFSGILLFFKILHRKAIQVVYVKH